MFDKRYLSHGISLYRVMMTLHFLNDIAYDVESTQKIKNDAISASLKSETMGKLINRIPGSRLLISSLPGSALNIVTPIVGVCNCSMFCCTLLCVRSSIAIILMGKRELVALLILSSWCLAMVGGLSSRCNGVVCGLYLWYFLIILTYYFWECLLTSRGLPSDSICVLKALPGKLDIKRHSPGIL